MNRSQVLTALLKGESIAGATGSQIEWATVHKPPLSPSLFTLKGRRLNRFCVGSDPEFCFVHPSNGARVEAHGGAGLLVGLAAGADQNERLVELRPWPDHSVVAHVAGIMSALRWMARVYPNTLVYGWRAGAHFGGDGIGGHVHFGRKRPTREEEVLGLDGLARVMMYTGMFPLIEWRQRMKPDRFGQQYGKPGDFRVQAHGYEYRTLPSWLQSPTTAFASICASKLVVLDPSVAIPWNGVKKLDTVVARNMLRGLAKLYKSRDDDAYILYHLLTTYGDQAFAVDYAGDFKAAWGIPAQRQIDDQRIRILPSSIKPQPEEIDEMQNHLLFGTPLTFARVQPTFVTDIPERYIWVPTVTAPSRRPGFGDFIHNLVTHSDYPVAFDFGSHERFRVAGNVPLSWTASDQKILRDYYPMVEIVPQKSTGTLITVPKGLCQAKTIAGLRAIIIHSGLFPVWSVETVYKGALEKWLKEHPIRKTKNPEWRNI